MNVTKTGIALVAFVVGCGAGGAASQLVIPSARAGTTPTRWEYLCITTGLNTERYNEAGDKGWEMAATPSFGAACFKRPLP